MSNDFVIFRNPTLRFRKEDFGGIAKVGSKTLIINKRQYQLILRIEKISAYSSLEKSDQDIAIKLIENNIFLKVPLDRAKELGFICS